MTQNIAPAPAPALIRCPLKLHVVTEEAAFIHLCAVVAAVAYQASLACEVCTLSGLLGQVQGQRADLQHFCLAACFVSKHGRTTYRISYPASSIYQLRSVCTAITNVITSRRHWVQQQLLPA
jgi:hypothetical protein